MGQFGLKQDRIYWLGVVRFGGFRERLCFSCLRFFFLCFFFLSFVSPAAASDGWSVFSFRWAPTPAQRAAWADRSPERPPDHPPIVSLKVALPQGCGQARLVLNETTWAHFSSSSRDPHEAPVAWLGQRGTWHGIAYQEILVRPLRLDGAGQAEALTELRATIGVRGDGYVLSPPLADQASLSEESALFLNPSGAVAFKGARDGRAEAIVRVNPVYDAGNQPLLRIDVSKDGIYGMDYAYLTSHGVPTTGILVENLHLMCRGVEIPVMLEGPSAGALSSSHSLLFYGQKLAIRDLPEFNGGDYSDTNVYWLYLGSTPGRRMANVAVAPTAGFPQAASFLDTLHVEVNNLNDSLDHFRPSGDNWFWAPYLIGDPGTTGSRTYNVALPHALPGTCTATSVVASLGTGAHTLAMTINGALPTAGPIPATWDGKAIHSETWGFTTGFGSGSNNVVLTVGGLLGQSDYQLLDYFEFTYPRTFDADAGVLRLTDSSTNSRYVSTGYSAIPYIFDVSAADGATGLCLPSFLTGASFSSSEGAVTFEMRGTPGAASRRVAISSAPLLPDAAVVPEAPAIPDPLAVPDLLIITHPDFHPDGEDAAWQAFLARRRSAMNVLPQDIQSIFNAYSYGLLDPKAIRAYLTAAAAAWGRLPANVLLLGDATFDYKNYSLAPAFKNRVPTMMFDDPEDTAYMGRYPSDAWYADVNGDGYPDTSVGRLPAGSYDELAGILGKIMAYEDQSAGTWTKKVLFVADTWTQPWEQVFEETSLRLQAAYVTPPWKASRLFFHKIPYKGTKADAFAKALRAAWPKAALIHYSGHSGVSSLGNLHAFFTSFPSRNCTGGTCLNSDVDLLPSISLPPATPKAQLPFVVSSSCYNSAFDELNGASLMSALVRRPDRGTIGSCGFSTIAYPDEEEQFADAFFSLAFGPAGVRFPGALVDAGRFSLPSTDTRSVMGNILLGDPSLELRLAAR